MFGYHFDIESISDFMPLFTVTTTLFGRQIIDSPSFDIAFCFTHR